MITWTVLLLLLLFIEIYPRLVGLSLLVNDRAWGVLFEGSQNASLRIVARQRLITVADIAYLC